MSFKQFQPGCCCCPVIGIDVAVATQWNQLFGDCLGSCANTSVIRQFLYLDISRIWDCQVVFQGFFYNGLPTGFKSVWWAEEDWPTVKEWVEAGGRLWIQAENANAMSGYQFALIDFLALLDCGMTYEGSAHAGGCQDSVAGAANISQGLTQPLRIAGTAEIGGGTVVFETSTGVPCVSVAPLGNGFVFLCGDNNCVGVCSFGIDVCEFFSRVWTYSDNNII